MNNSGLNELCLYFPDTTSRFPDRYVGIQRDYSPEEVEKLRGSIVPECTYARRGADKLWQLVSRGGDSYVNALGCLTGEIR